MSFCASYNVLFVKETLDSLYYAYAMLNVAEIKPNYKSTNGVIYVVWHEKYEIFTTLKLDCRETELNGLVDFFKKSCGNVARVIGVNLCLFLKQLASIDCEQSPKNVLIS